MPYGSEFLGNVGTGLMNFAGSGLGQTAIGAGLGYGMDRLAGGKGKTGAILGGIGGLMNYGTGSGGSMFGFGDNANNFNNTAIGGLFGSGASCFNSCIFLFPFVFWFKYYNIVIPYPKVEKLSIRYYLDLKQR